ncbi:hypothetical protein [Bradyrhizobium sp. S3.5.5]|uniref:hypothetical protein n=1 Tax=unclassified Bradyrhizobium TaxID=2631580 RepID=UPI003399682C
MPSIWEAVAYIRDGGLISYGPSFPEMYRRSAGYVAKILKGIKPSDLPLEQPTRFDANAAGPSRRGNRVTDICSDAAEFMRRPNQPA